MTQLARLASVGFASAYRELRAMQALDLVASERLAGAESFRLNTAHPMAEPLGKLASAVRHPAAVDATDERLRRQLRALGAPLVGEGTEPLSGSIEETIVHGIRLAHRDASVARALPVCIHAQRDAVTPEHLRLHALALGEKRALGFFLDLTAVVSGDRRFAAWARQLRDRRCTAMQSFFHGASRSALSRELELRNTPPPARRWHYQMNMNLDAFQSTFTRFADAAIAT